MNKVNQGKRMTGKQPLTTKGNRWAGGEGEKNKTPYLNEESGVFGKLERITAKDKKRDEARRDREGKWPGWV